MVFTELLKKYQKEVKEAVDELFEVAYKNQKIDTELLLVIIHGFHDDKNLEFFKREKLSPYVFGPAHVGYSLDAFYEFFHSYRTSNRSKKAFTKLLQDPEHKEVTEYHERLTFNIELLIYLKFWESDLILRQLYNLANLASGKYYDWHFSLSYSRRTFIRGQIQAPLKEVCPKTHKLIEDIYSAQIRNAIAHSKYYFMGRNIQLGNKEENKFYKRHNIPFDEWEIIFHKTLLFYNFIIGNLQKYDKMYQTEVSDKHFGLPLSTPRLTNLGLRKSQWVKYDSRRHRWLWSNQMDD